MDKPLVSVIIPAYNRAHTVAESIDSVQQQTYPNIEVIVVDDGSTDDTQAVLGKYGTSIRNIRQENAGQVGARNRGIREARGDIITFLDSDDLLAADLLGKACAGAAKLFAGDALQPGERLVEFCGRPQNDLVSEFAPGAAFCRGAVFQYAGNFGFAIRHVLPVHRHPARCAIAGGRL